MIDTILGGWSWDLTAAVGLIVVALVIAVLAQLNVLPQRSVSLILMGVLAALGFSAVKSKRDQARLLKKFDLLKAELEEKEKHLAALRTQAGVSESELQDAKAARDTAEHTYHETLGEIEQRRGEAHAAADALSRQDAADAARRATSDYDGKEGKDQ